MGGNGIRQFPQAFGVEVAPGLKTAPFDQVQGEAGQAPPGLAAIKGALGGVGQVAGVRIPLVQTAEQGIQTAAKPLLPNIHAGSVLVWGVA